MAGDSLEAMLDAVAVGDKEALHEIYQRTSAKLYGVVTQIVGRRDWADEVTQDVYVRIWRQAHRYQPGLGQPMTWMITIARNLAIDRVRSEGSRHHVDIDDLHEVLPAHAPDPEAKTIGNDEAERLSACLEELAENYRLCIRLAYWQGYSHSELAERLSTPLGTVKTWTRRGLQLLRDCLDR